MYCPEINRSYFFGVDIKRGWGNTSYFTYFSEFNRPLNHVAYVKAGFLTLFLFSVIGSTLMTGIILRTRELKTITNYRRTSVARTLMARLPRLYRTRS